jgi:hypothetical protein
MTAKLTLICGLLAMVAFAGTARAATVFNLEEARPPR